MNDKANLLVLKQAEIHFLQVRYVPFVKYTSIILPYKVYLEYASPLGKVCSPADVVLCCHILKRSVTSRVGKVYSAADGVLCCHILKRSLASRVGKVYARTTKPVRSINGGR